MNLFILIKQIKLIKWISKCLLWVPKPRRQMNKMIPTRFREEKKKGIEESTVTPTKIAEDIPGNTPK